MAHNHTATAEEIAQHLEIGVGTFRKYRTADLKEGRTPLSFERRDRVVYFDPAECEQWLKLRDFRGQRLGQPTAPKAKVSKADRTKAPRKDPIPVLQPCTVWHAIPVVPWYQINIETGEVRNAATCKPVKSYINKDGYLQVTLTLRNGSKGFLINRLVAKAAHGSIANQRQCASHLDGNRLNNNHANISWKSPLENARDREIHGTVACGAANGNSKLTESDAWRAYFMFHVEKMSTRDIGTELGISYKTVQQIASHKTWVKSAFATRLAQYLETEAQANTSSTQADDITDETNPFFFATDETTETTTTIAQPIINWFTINADEMLAQLDAEDALIIPAASIIAATAPTKPKTRRF